MGCDRLRCFQERSREQWGEWTSDWVKPELGTGTTTVVLRSTVGARSSARPLHRTALLSQPGRLRSPSSAQRDRNAYARSIAPLPVTFKSLHWERGQGDLANDNACLVKDSFACGVHRVAERVDHFAHAALHNLDRAPQARAAAKGVQSKPSASVWSGRSCLTMSTRGGLH